MSCVVELPTDTTEFADEPNDPIVEESSHSVHIGATDLEQGIPTFDASDVDHELKRSQSHRLVQKSLIILAAYNPLPLLRLALVRAHTRDVDDLSDRKRFSTGILKHHKATPLWDLEVQSSSDDCFVRTARHDDLVNHLPVSTQREFRQRVLQGLLLYLVLITFVVSASLLCIPWASAHALMDQSPYLLPVAEAGVAAIAALSLWLVYALRFDSPVNYAALAFLTLSEMACTVAYGVTNDPHEVVQASSLLLCGVILLRAFASQAASHHDDELLCPAQAAVRSITVVVAVVAPLNAVIGEEITHMSATSLLGQLAFMSAVLLWVSLVLTVLTQTMTPEEHASALVFFQADLVVLAIVEPGRVLLKYLKQCKRSMQQLVCAYDDEDTKPHQTAVVPAFWPDRKQADGAMGDSVATSIEPMHGTVSYPEHLIPLRVRECVRNDSRTDVSHATRGAGESRPTPPFHTRTSLNQASLGGPRRRNSTADD
jgi:hypothetical protein